MVESAPFDEKTKATYRISLLTSAIATGKSQVLNGQRSTVADMRRQLEQTLRRQAARSNVPAERAAFIDQANKLRPWSMT
jgi:hypothetical protein